MIDFNVIRTGSKGNAVVINNIVLIDCGVPFSALREVYKDLDLVLLTHIHSDHFNRHTIRKLSQERPMLRFGCPSWLVSDVSKLVEPKQIDVYEMDNTYCYLDKFSVKPFQLVHNVENCGYSLSFCGVMALYATDTNTLNHIDAKNYDLYLVEANYTEEDITERIRRKQDNGEYCYEWEALKNHLSKEKCDNWLYENMGSNSKYVYLHGHVDK